VDKKQFNTVVKRFTSTSKREAEEILSLKAQYPYSQLLTALAARVSKDHNFTIHNEELSMAAVYAADRSVLKDVMTYQPVEEVLAPVEEAEIETVVEEPETPAAKEPLTPPPVVVQNVPDKPAEEVAEKVEMKVAETKSEPIQPPRVEKVIRYNTESDDVAEEVMQDLKKLSQLKHNFEMLLTDYAETSNRSEKVTRKNGATPEESLPKKEKKIEKVPPKAAGKESLRVRRERMIAHAKSLQAQNSSENNSTSETSPRPKRKDAQDKIIDDIKKNNAELKPESEKQKEQINIINQFIKTQPSISNPQEHPPQASGDLSQIRSGEFTDNIISETLVEILVKQGKKDKAIEVLKKLIWKYPQKKAYFASQIEDLKK
jgi:hypothetical protein